MDRIRAVRDAHSLISSEPSSILHFIRRLLGGVPSKRKTNHAEPESVTFEQLQKRYAQLRGLRYYRVAHIKIVHIIV